MFRGIWWGCHNINLLSKFHKPLTKIKETSKSPILLIFGHPFSTFSLPFSSFLYHRQFCFSAGVTAVVLAPGVAGFSLSSILLRIRAAQLRFFSLLCNFLSPLLRYCCCYPVGVPTPLWLL